MKIILLLLLNIRLHRADFIIENSTEIIEENNSTDDYFTAITTTTTESFNNSHHQTTNLTITKNNLTIIRKNRRDHQLFCTCDLQLNFCDLNCCCDLDCSVEDKEIFQFCEIEKNRFVDDRFCSFINYIYVNNTPFEWQVNNNGFFCIISKNVPKSYKVQKEKFISLKEAKEKPPFWDSLKSNNNDEFPIIISKNYNLGEPLLVIKNDSNLDYFNIPTNIIAPICNSQYKISYLTDYKGICSQINFNHQDNKALNFETYFKGFKIIKNPYLLSNKTLLYKGCPKNICIEIEAKLCDTNFNNCSKIENSSKITFSCSFNLKQKLNYCLNGVQKIFYKFYHNGTFGVTKVELLGVLKNFTYPFAENNYHFNQYYYVEFLWTNQSRNLSEMFSGNPGYIFGKPILIGTKIQRNNVTFIRRNFNSYISNFFVFPGNNRGNCIRDEFSYLGIEFGYNLRSNCNFYANISYNTKKNSSELCKSIQQTIFDMWGLKNNKSSLVYGFYGNSLADNLENWNEFLYDKFTTPENFLNYSIHGNLTKDKNSTLLLSCYNISTILDVKVFYSSIDIKESLLNQRKILGILINYFSGTTYYNGIKLRIENNNSIRFKTKLINQISFHDITERKSRKFVEPPLINIRLPYDFFYPFIKISNDSNNNCSQQLCFFLLVILLVIIS